MRPGGAPPVMQDGVQLLASKLDGAYKIQARQWGGSAWNTLATSNAIDNNYDVFVAIETYIDGGQLYTRLKYGQAMPAQDEQLNAFWVLAAPTLSYGLSNYKVRIEYATADVDNGSRLVDYFSIGSSVPEPTTVGLASVALASLAIRLRRGRRRRA